MDLAWNGFRKKRIESALFEHFDPERLEAVKMFHESVPGYDETPLVHLDNLAENIGVGNIYVKDESERFGLNAFKGLGGIHAVAEYFRNHEGMEFDGYDGLLSALENRPPVTFATATDGNHGKGLAWAASLLDQQAKVFMPEGSEVSRLEAIRELGAEAEIMDLNYDDTVGRVAALAEENGWVLVQDTAWPGYEEIPLSIMKGYTTIITEVQSQLGRPEGDDQSIVSGESGAAPFGAFHRLMTEEEYQEESQRLGLDDTSNVLFISTEGDTDAANYERVMTRRL